MSTFDAAREAALKLALQHHAVDSSNATSVVETARVFLDFLNADTDSDRAFREKIERLAETQRPLD